MLLCLTSFVRHYVCNSFRLLHGAAVYSILFLQSCLLCPTMYFPISLLMDTVAVSAFWLTLIKLWTFPYSYLGEHYLRISVGNAGNGVELPGYRTYVFLVLVDTAKYFSKEKCFISITIAGFPAFWGNCLSITLTSPLFSHNLKLLPKVLLITGFLLYIGQSYPTVNIPTS